MCNLDQVYGHPLPPQVRESSGKAYDDWESMYTPGSLIELTTHTANRLTVLMQQVADGCPIATTLVNDIVFIWVIDQLGRILLAAEELVLDAAPMYLVKHQEMRLTRYQNKLGHPALVSCEAARIGGEIKYLPRTPNREGIWIITNGSGRYGVHESRTAQHLANVAAHLSSIGISLKPEFYRPRVKK